MPANIKTRVGIIRGGAGKHYEYSIQKGGDIISHIFEKLSHKYKIIDILVDKNNVWHAGGVPINPSDLLDKIDVAWNVLHDINVSPILNNLAIPNIGNEYFLGALKNNNEILREHVKDLGIQMPRSIVIPLYQKDFNACPPSLRSGEGGRGPKEQYINRKAKEVLNKFSAPWIVKSFTPDSSMGIHLVKTFGELVDAIADGVAHDKSILVEEFILGKVTSLHSVSGFRGEDVYVFPPLNFSISEKEKINSIVKDLHTHLGVNHYLKSDFLLHPKLGFFLTNVDFSPDLRIGSHFEQSCKYVGADTYHVIDHLLERVLNKR